MSAIVGTRVTPRGNVSQTAGKTYISHQRISTNNEHHIDGASGLQVARVQIDIVSKSYATTTDLAEKCRLAADGYRGLVSIGADSLNLKQCYLTDQSESPTNPTAGAEHGTFVINQDWELGYAVSVPNL